MFCTHCGQTNADDARFCQRCGQPFAATTNRLAEPPVTFVPPPGGTQGPLPPGEAGVAETDGKAIASLVSSLVFFLFPLSQIAAIVLGHISRADIRRSGGRKKGEGMALAGLILGYVQVAMLPVVLIVAAIAIPNILLSRQLANEASAVATLNTIRASQSTIHEQKQSFSCDPSDFMGSGLREALNGKPKNGYRFELQGCSAETYKVVGKPASNSTGTRTFCSDETGVVKATKGRVDANECLQR